MKTVFITTIAAMLLLALAGCEKEPVTNPSLNKYKYVVETQAENTYVQYLDSANLFKSINISGNWEIEFVQTGPRGLYISASTEGETVLLAVRIIKNDTIEAAASVNNSEKDVSLYCHF